MKKSSRHDKISDLIKRISKERPESSLEALVLDVLKEINAPSIEELWFEDENISPISYWLLITNDAFEHKEASLIKQILFWREIYGKNQIRFKCLHAANSYFYSLCARELKPKSFPVLFVSDDPFFSNTIQLGKDILFSISEDKIIGLLNSVLREISSGNPILELENKLGFTNLKHSNKIERVRLLISKGDIFLAIDELELQPNLSSEFSNEITLVRNNLTDLESRNLKGILNHEEYIRLKNQIINRLMKIIISIKE